MLRELLYCYEERGGELTVWCRLSMMLLPAFAFFYLSNSACRAGLASCCSASKSTSLLFFSAESVVRNSLRAALACPWDISIWSVSRWCQSIEMMNVNKDNGGGLKITIIKFVSEISYIRDVQLQFQAKPRSPGRGWSSEKRLRSQPFKNHDNQRKWSKLSPSSGFWDHSV